MKNGPTIPLDVQETNQPPGRARSADGGQGSSFAPRPVSRRLCQAKMSENLPKPIRAYVGSFVARKRAYAMLKAIGTALAVGLGWTIIACALDRWLQLSSAMRVAFLTMGALAVAIILMPALARLLRRRLDWVGVADEIEKVNPQFGERLRTVISQQLERQEYRGSPQMLDYLL